MSRLSIYQASRTVSRNGQMKTPTYMIYIENVLLGNTIPVPLMPNNISESIKANFAEQAIIGSSRPFMTYTSTSLRGIGFTLQNLSQDYLPDGYRDLRDYIHALQALLFPEYESSGLVKPPDCKLHMGDRSFRCVCNSVNVTWSDLVRENNIMTCNVDLQFTNTRNDDQVPRSNTYKR